MSTWVLLRGLTRESRHWGDFPDILREHLEAFLFGQSKPIANYTPPQGE